MKNFLFKSCLFASLFLSSTAHASAPAAPTDLQLVAGTNYVDIRWHDNASDETGYKIFRDGKLLTTTNANTQHYHDSSLTPNTAYAYVVKATNDTNTTHTISIDKGENDTCDGELLTGIDGISVAGTYTGYGDISDNSDKDYFHFKPAVAGTYVLSVSSDTGTIGMLVGSTCDVDDYFRGDSKASHSFSAHARAEEDITLRVWDYHGDGTPYLLSIRFVPDSGEVSPPDGGGEGHTYANHLSDGNQGLTTPNETVTNDETVGTVKGGLVVAQGKAQYNLDIPVPPGRAGMEPKLSIDYSSSGSNGYLGKDWGIGGLSVITRCSNDKTIDATARAIQLDRYDQYCMDGKRLIKIGENGAQIEYKTEINNHSKIIAYQPSESRYGPESWTVYTKSGLIYEYGVVASNNGSKKNNSKIIANYHDVHTKKSRSISESVDADKIVISWAVSAIKDRTADGNIIEFFYNQDPENQERYIESIKYTGGEVVFHYDDSSRKDTVSGYLAGSKYKISKLLTGISINDLTQKNLENYHLTYESNAFNTRLIKIAHEVGGASLSPLHITWSKASHTKQDFLRMVDKKHDTINSIIGLVDYNNNGELDFVEKKFQAMIQSPGDMNGDGFVDEIIINLNNDDKVHVTYGGNSMDFSDHVVATSFTQGLDLNLAFSQLSDINNDGKADIILATKSGDIYASLSTGSSYPKPSKILHINNLEKGQTPMNMVDLNNDGFVDIIHFNTHFVEVSYNINGTFRAFEVIEDLGTKFTKASPDNWYGLTEKGEEKFPKYFVDVNGDGYRDILGFANDGVAVSINTGNGFEPPYHASAHFGYAEGWGHDYQTRRVLADMNGDGYIDIVSFSGLNVDITYGTGKKSINEGFIDTVNVATDFGMGLSWNHNSYRGVADLNNDGTLDIIGFKDEDLYRCISLDRHVAVTDFTNKKDQFIRLKYASLGIAGVFEKGAESPVGITLTPATKVVSEVAIYDNSIDNIETIDTYQYSEYRVNKKRGSLGFGRIKTAHWARGDAQSFQAVTMFYQTFPYIGMAKEAHTGFNLPLFSPVQGELATSIYSEMAYKEKIYPINGINYKIYDIYTKKVNSEDLLGSVSTSTYTDIHEDGLGNVRSTLTEKVSYRGDSASKFITKTSNRYNDNTNNWLIGRLASTTVEMRNKDDEIITKVSEFAYDSTTGLMTKEAIEPSQTKNIYKYYTYDAYGNKVTETISGYKLPEGIQTTYIYSDAYNHRFLTKVINPQGHTQTNTYDASTGAVKSITDTNGNTIEYSYDALGKKIKEYSLRDNQSAYYAHTWGGLGYDKGLYSVATWGDNKPFSRTVYDKFAREIVSYRYDMFGKKILARKFYNNDGTLARESLPTSGDEVAKFIRYGYDKHKRVSSVTSPSPMGGGSTRKEIGYQFLVTTTSQEGITTSITKDARGKTVKVVDPDYNTIYYSYYPDGKLRTTTDSNGNTITLTYDILGHKSSSHDPDMGEWVYDYDALGRPTTIIEPNNRISLMDYDKLGRIYRKYIGGYNYHWFYDDSTIGKKGTLTEETKHTDQGKNRYEKSYSYDSKARLVSTIEKIHVNDVSAEETYLTKFTYYNNNRLKDLTYPNNLTIRHYYRNGALEKIKDADTGKTLYTIQSTNAFGKVTSAIREGIQEHYSYNQIGLQTQQSAYIGNEQKIDLTYSYNQRGNLESKHDHYIGAIGEGLKESYSYDNLNRLIEVQVDSSLLANNGHLLHYSYDTLGNLTDKNGLGISYKSTKPHQIDRVHGITYQYDANGNLLKDDRHTFAYDSGNKVTSIRQDGKTITFDYSSSGKRYQKQIEGTAFTHYIGKIYENSTTDLTTANRVEKNFIYFGSRLVAIKQREVTNLPKEAKILYPYHDRQSNVIAILDERYQVIDRRSYTPFGTIRDIPYNEQLDANKIPSLTQRLTNTTNRAYTGHESIEGTDTIHMNGRVYDTIVGRFTTADPFIQAASNTQSYNRYSYVMNNPVNFIDPSGYNWLKSSGRWLRKKKGHLKHWGQDHRQEIKQGVAIVAAVVTTAATGGAAGPGWAGFFSAVGAGAAGGAVSGAIMTGTLKGAAQGALWGGISGGVAFGVAETASAIAGVSSEVGHGATLLSDASGGYSQAQVQTAGLVKALGHGLSRAAMQEARYGTTKGAFMSGFISSGFSVGAGAGPVKGAFQMAIIGGTVSELGGGKFANGAMGSAFQYLLNDTWGDLMAKRVAFPSEKTRMESAETLDKALGTASTVTGVVGGFASSLPHPMAKIIGAGLGTSSLGLTGLKHLNASMAGNFRGQDLAVDIILDKTQYVKNPFFESLYDETFGIMAEEFGK